MLPAPGTLTCAAPSQVPQNLAKFCDYADTQRYNLDGTPKADKSPSFWVVDARASYQWNRTFSTYLGINNIFNYQQTRKDSYLWLDRDGNLDVTQVWGPNIGRTFIAGVKVSF